MVDQRAQKILSALKENLAVPNWTVQQHTPFETLIATIISQNTSDTNTERAFGKLSKKFIVTPHTLAKAETAELEECLHVGGLYKSKAQTIKTVSTILDQEYDGSLETLLNLPLDLARKRLIELPGVGPKTADVVLLFSANQPTVPVDTHVNRVSKRLGLSPSDGDYDAVRLSLQAAFESKDYLAVHLLLISLGRAFCRARKPLCSKCPVNSYCSSRGLEK